ncbi:MAG: enoyl-CoA hydratase/isomerase family protein [Candidatus Azotimanducaceae bacterium]|uniref:Enoyl-CoA hydratase/isomerase family protein n=1 Tax=OM182 bacterium TaxID=2510334 RepID=A0A520S2F1_9GAMM|nr:enoyl-CoA hydratase [Gammaproteobacteria bacterium]OUV68250.1 MAG: hypothetical protein CBC93_02675 [Gammaproteobacteria bacterium TMED133]RZO76657.1 MAG: enoyl-CoA hydratase/isomerase family protein [OM182 bacterium]
MAEKFVLTTLAQGVGEIILNRPAKRNAITGPIVHDLDTALQNLMADRSCTVIIIRGADGVFCAGLDSAAFNKNPAPVWRRHFQEDWANLHNNFFMCPKPIIGAVEQYGIAAGAALAFACDFLVVGEQAFLHVAEVQMGLMAPINVAWLAIRYSHALGLKMALQGEPVYGRELFQLGIANECCEDSEVLNIARKLGYRLAKYDSETLRNMKLALRKPKGITDFYQVLGEVKNS